ncbi:MAG TPA: DUF2244 domain-containing protein [Methylotenera sp.]|nr:DUF2244 domain-containing protein [Methylotenera sp.]HPH05362.1 DUF2244 domain-containing protein [Methylotenera sp.]
MAVLDLGCSIVARPNNSLSAKDNVFLLLAIAIVSLMIALSFALIGAWLVLPFAGLEILAFAYAFNYIYVHSNDFESITIQNDSVVVEKRSDKKVTKTVFQRYWAQVSVRNVDGNGGLAGKTSLYISSHGKEVEFGGNLINDEQRIELALAIKQKIKNID